MKLPKELKVGSGNIKIEIAELGDNLLGMYDTDSHVISLNKNQSDMSMTETFWHELIHAINDYNRVTVEIATEIQKEDANPEDAWNLEERMTENFAKVFLQVIQDNKLLGITN